MRVNLSMSLIVLVAVGAFSLPVDAQHEQSEISVNFTGNFQKEATSFAGKTDSATHSGGVLLNYRYHFNRWSAIETNYGSTRFSQNYSSGYTTQARANEVTLAYVTTLGRPASARVRPFFEAGTGALLFSPIAAGSTVGGRTQSEGLFLYGGGVDWRADRNVSVRLGYRGLLYTAPDFVVAVQTTNARTHMAEPYIGISFRF